MSVEGFTCLLVFKNLFSFGLTFKGFDWLVQADSTKKMFIALGSVQIAICALTIPLCKFHSSRLSTLDLTSLYLDRRPGSLEGPLRISVEIRANND